MKRLPLRSSHPIPERRAHSARHGKSRAAFTLIETILVVTVIGVLMVLAFRGSQAIIGQGKSVKCIGNLRQIGIAMIAYATDHNGFLPYEAGQRDYNSPYVMIGHMVYPDRGLVGYKGSQGYLPWNGDVSTPLWCDTFLCPGDPNRKVYYNLRSDPGSAYPGSYLYRQNTIAAGLPGDPINLRRRVDGVNRWLVRDRNVFGHADTVKPFTGREAELPGPAQMVRGDRVTNTSFWHHDQTNVLYEDGSVQTRRWGEPLGIAQ